ncbi:FAD linked oxidase, C-terminal domain protein, partial [Vibrio parahaemolyticus V-223/04]
NAWHQYGGIRRARRRRSCCAGRGVNRQTRYHVGNRRSRHYRLPSL